MIYLIPIILFLIPLVVKLVIDFKKWKAIEPVNHNKEWRLVALSELTTSGVFFFVLCPQNVFISIIATVGMIASWYWFIFDFSFNLIRLYWAKKCSWHLEKGQYSFWYTGSDDDDDAKTDDFLQRLPLWAHITLKLGLIILFTYLYAHA